MWLKTISYICLTLAVALMSFALGLRHMEKDCAYYVFDNFINNSEFLKCMGVTDLNYNYGYLNRKEKGLLTANDTLSYGIG